MAVLNKKEVYFLRRRATITDRGQLHSPRYWLKAVTQEPELKHRNNWPYGLYILNAEDAREILEKMGLPE